VTAHSCVLEGRVGGLGARFTGPRSAFDSLCRPNPGTCAALAVTVRTKGVVVRLVRALGKSQSGLGKTAEDLGSASPGLFRASAGRRKPNGPRGDLEGGPGKSFRCPGRLVKGPASFIGRGSTLPRGTNRSFFALEMRFGRRGNDDRRRRTYAPGPRKHGRGRGKSIPGRGKHRRGPISAPKKPSKHARVPRMTRRRALNLVAHRL
jgi:hypothetical protein